MHHTIYRTASITLGLVVAACGAPSTDTSSSEHDLRSPQVEEESKTPDQKRADAIALRTLNTKLQRALDADVPLVETSWAEFREMPQLRGLGRGFYGSPRVWTFSVNLGNKVEDTFYLASATYRPPGVDKPRYHYFVFDPQGQRIVLSGIATAPEADIQWDANNICTPHVHGGARSCNGI